ncbi:MAG: hypothetical protein ABSD21_11145 [Rhizomicrobium sp.]|jgi:uncharacterized membrane protein YgaE (UPF0421/DUF939 family)
MRRVSQYILAAFLGGALGGMFAESETLLGVIIGVGVGMLIVFFCHVYPRVGYAEQKINSPFSGGRKINS